MHSPINKKALPIVCNVLLVVGMVCTAVRAAFAQTCNDFGAGMYQNAEEAALAFVAQCAQ